LSPLLYFSSGPKKLPDLGEGIAEGIRNFKIGLKEFGAKQFDLTILCGANVQAP